MTRTAPQCLFLSSMCGLFSLAFSYLFKPIYFSLQQQQRRCFTFNQHLNASPAGATKNPLYPRQFEEEAESADNHSEVIVHVKGMLVLHFPFFSTLVMSCSSSHLFVMLTHAIHSQQRERAIHSLELMQQEITMTESNNISCSPGKSTQIPAVTQNHPRRFYIEPYSRVFPHENPFSIKSNNKSCHS